MTQDAQNPYFYSHGDKIDISNAKYSDALSNLVLKSERYFEATFDRLLFKSLHEIAIAALEANSFSPNIENVLFALGNARIGVRCTKTSKSGEKVVASEILPALQIALPAKADPGDLLRSFYKEIASYEEALAKAQSEVLKASSHDDNHKTKEALLKELKHLRERNQDLHQRIEMMSTKLKSLEIAAQAKADSEDHRELLPKGIRRALVLRADFERRMLVVKTEAGQTSIPMSELSALPMEGSECLISIENGTQKGAFFFESSSFPLRFVLADVLHVEGDSIKIRDDGRNEITIRALNPKESSLISTLTRGDCLLLKMFETHLCAFDRLQKRNTFVFSEHVQEAIAVAQIREDFFNNKFGIDETKREKVE